MKKLFTFIAVALFAASASATTPYKCLYAEAEVAPTGVGEVYLDVKNDDERNYVKDQSEDYGDTAFLQAVLGENGGGDQDSEVNCTKGLGIYEAIIYAEAAEGYEFVCLSNVLKDEADAVYSYAECYMPFSGEGTTEDPRVWDWNLYESISDGVKINVNAPDEDKPSCGSSSTDGSTPSRESYIDDDSQWSETPDTKIYAIFRKVGDEYPKLVESTGEETPCENPVIAYTDAEGLSITTATTRAKCVYSISAEDQKSGNVNGKVDITATYNITAYATAVGYLDSDTITAKLVFVTDGATVENTGDTENITEAKVRGIIVSSHDGVVSVSGLKNDESVEFYTVDGKLMGKANSSNGSASFASNSKVVVAKVGEKSVKVAVK